MLEMENHKTVNVGLMTTSRTTIKIGGRLPVTVDAMR